MANADQEYLSGRMLKELSPQTLAKIFRQSSKRLPTLGAIDLNGNCLIHRGFYPKTESGYTLSDILQNPSEIGEEFFLSKLSQERIISYRDNKQTLIQSYSDTETTHKEAILLNAQVIQVGTRLDSNGGTQPYQQDRVYDADGIVPALNKGKSDLILRVKSATSAGYEQAVLGDSINISQPNSKTRRGRVGKQKAQTLETSCNQAVVQPNYSSKSLNETIERNILTEGEPKALDLYNRQARDESPTLTEPHHNSLRLFDGYRIRRLTPIECERLQGFPDDHTAYGNYDGEVKPMSNNQRYKQCGNAVTVDVVGVIATKIKPLFK